MLKNIVMNFICSLMQTQESSYELLIGFIRGRPKEETSKPSQSSKVFLMPQRPLQELQAPPFGIVRF